MELSHIGKSILAEGKVCTTHQFLLTRTEYVHVYYGVHHDLQHYELLSVVLHPLLHVPIAPQSVEVRYFDGKPCLFFYEPDVVGEHACVGSCEYWRAQTGGLHCAFPPFWQAHDQNGPHEAVKINKNTSIGVFNIMQSV